MFWIELYLVYQMASWFVCRLGLNLSSDERNALSVFLGLGIKSFLLFTYIAFGLARFVTFPEVLTVVVFLLYFSWVKTQPLTFGELFFARGEGARLRECFGFWILCVLFILSLTNASVFPITGADGIWHHIKGMVYGQVFADFDSEQIISQFRQYPPLIGLLFGWLVYNDFERITIIFPILYLCLLVVVFYRIREHTQNSTIAGVATLLVGTTPYLWWHSFLPFLDWTAGVFYAVGVLYWFSLIKNISASTGNIDINLNRSLAVLSGIFFGLASWTRPEFFIYSVLPLFLLVCIFDWKKEPVIERNSVIARFSIAALILPSLWFAILLNFNSPLDSTFEQLIMVCAGLWTGLGLVLSNTVFITPRTSIMITISALVVGLAGLFFFLPPNISPWTALAIRLFRLFAVHIFFAGTVFLVVFLFTERLRQLTPAEKTLGVLLLSFLIAQFFIYAYAGLKWPTLSLFIDNTFVFPGNSINLSDTRGTIAFYPVFVFFIFCLPKIRNGLNFSRVRQFLFSIVAINLVIISVVFAGPRIQFMVDHFNQSYEQLTETSGPPDLPNQFKKSYQVARQLREKLNRSQLLFLPPGNKKGSIRSVMVQMLFGEKLIFADDPDFWRDLGKEGSRAHVFGRSVNENNFCHGANKEVLGDTEFILCRLDE